jgi:hypothetical protein
MILAAQVLVVHPGCMRPADIELRHRSLGYRGIFHAHVL